MNERYLFRGKYAGTIPDFAGQWVTGDCVYLGGKAYIHPQNNITKVNEYDITKLLIVHPVVRETLGQYTGLRDVSGRAIYEGDILKAKTDTFIVKHGEFTPVHFSEYLKDYGCSVVKMTGFYALDMRTHEGCFLASTLKCEVIGNIHDNPELLEAAQ